MRLSKEPAALREPPPGPAPHLRPAAAEQPRAGGAGVPAEPVGLPPVCGGGGPIVVEDCATNGDEDGNGLSDCNDPACCLTCGPASPACNTVENCSNGSEDSNSGC